MICIAATRVALNLPNQPPLILVLQVNSPSIPHFITDCSDSDSLMKCIYSEGIWRNALIPAHCPLLAPLAGAKGLSS